MIPDFTPAGYLPPGIHEATWEEVRARFGYTEHRNKLLAGLEKASNDLRGADCRRMYIDGSFVTNKRVPGDFDCCWDVAGVNYRLLKPILLNIRPPRQAQKIIYGGDLLPANGQATPSGTIYLEFFQTDKKTHKRKGIVAINL